MRYLVLFALLLVLASCTPPPEPTPTAPSALTPTATPIATATPVPTPTPSSPPAATPTPTAIPWPPPIPTPTPLPSFLGRAAIPQIPPIPTPTPTPLPSLRASAEELAASIKGQLVGVASSEEFRPLAATIGGEAVDMLCMISDGMFEPDLELEDLTDSRRMHLVIKAHCINLESG